MRAKMLILGVALCASAAGVCVSLGGATDDSETALAGIVGGQLPRDCVYVRFPEPGDTCADDVYTAPCYFTGPGYLTCSDSSWYTSCTQEPKYCRERDLYSGDCATSWTACTGTWAMYTCTGVAPLICGWELIAVYPCGEHPFVPTKPWCYEI